MGQRVKSDKRPRILNAAVKVFADKGFYCARVSDVAREAGVADGTIYLYFKSKEELLRGLFEENMTRILAGIREVVKGAESSADALAKLFDAYVTMTQREPELAEVLTVELRESGKFMNEFAAPLFGEFLRIITQLLEDGQARGELRTDFTARTISRAMFGAMDELSLAWVMSSRRWNLNEAGREVLEVFLGGLRVRPAAEGGVP